MASGIVARDKKCRGRQEVLRVARDLRVVSWCNYCLFRHAEKQEVPLRHACGGIPVRAPDLGLTSNREQGDCSLSNVQSGEVSAVNAALPLRRHQPGRHGLAQRDRDPWGDKVAAMSLPRYRSLSSLWC